MILDTLENLEKYISLNPYFKRVVEYIANNKLQDHENGKVLLDGENLFANFCTLDGKSKENAKLEAHDKMIDIQIPLNCTEIMGYTSRASLPVMAYNADNDITFYEGLSDQYIKVEPGMFVIFFPQDAHAPCIGAGNRINKVIFKVKVN